MNGQLEKILDKEFEVNLALGSNLRLHYHIEEQSKHTTLSLPNESAIPFFRLPDPNEIRERFSKIIENTDPTPQPIDKILKNQLEIAASAAYNGLLGYVLENINPETREKYLRAINENLESTKIITAARMLTEKSYFMTKDAMESNSMLIRFVNRLMLGLPKFTLTYPIEELTKHYIAGGVIAEVADKTAKNLDEVGSYFDQKGNSELTNSIEDLSRFYWKMKTDFSNQSTRFRASLNDRTENFDLIFKTDGTMARIEKMHSIALKKSEQTLGKVELALIPTYQQAANS